MFSKPIFIVLCAATFPILSSTNIAQAKCATAVTVCFTPEYHDGNCTEQISSAIRRARKSILVQAYSFTSAPIAKTLVEAHQRGVDVRVILDRSNVRQGYSSAVFLEHMGIPTMIDSEHAIAHNKVMIIDEHQVISGSFNFTRAAEDRNAENVLFIDDPAVAAAYTLNWNEHLAHSKPIETSGRKRTDSPTPNSHIQEETKTAPDQIVGNKRSHIYEWPGCPAYKSILPENRVLFTSREAAVTAGYRPARNCPP